VRACVARLPIVEIVGAPSHRGRIVVVIAKAEIALAAEEIARLAGLVIVIDAQAPLRQLQTDDANTLLSSHHRGVFRHRQAVPSHSRPGIAASAFLTRYARLSAFAFSRNSGSSAYRCFARSILRRVLAFEASSMGETLLVRPMRSPRLRARTPSRGAKEIRAADGGASRTWPAGSQAGGLAARCSPALPVIRAAGASAIGGKEPRDIRVVLVRPVPGHAFIADEVARRSGFRTMIDA
jgi:nitrate reductase NapAB chaperone NapD